jgi:hypothetical protein
MMWRRSRFTIAFISSSDSSLEQATSAAVFGAEAEVTGLLLQILFNKGNCRLPTSSLIIYQPDFHVYISLTPDSISLKIYA